MAIWVSLDWLGFPGGSVGKESAYNAGDLSLIPGLGRSPGGGHSNPLQYACLENPHGQRSLAGYSPWDHKELDVTERLSLPLLSLNIHTFPTFSVSFYPTLLKTQNVKIHGKISVEATFNQGQSLNRKVKAICLPAIYVFTSLNPSVLHKVWVRNVSCF